MTVGFSETSGFNNDATQRKTWSNLNHFQYIYIYIYIFCPASFRETRQWLKFPLNGLGAQSRVRPVVGMLPLASGPACLGMAFPALLVKQLYRCDSVVISSFVTTGYTARRWGWLLGRIGYSITPHYPLYRNGSTSGPNPWQKYDDDDDNYISLCVCVCARASSVS